MKDDIILNINSIKKNFVRNFVNIRGESENERLNIIDDLDLPIHKGKITALIGGNGAGKTTLFNIISGFINADEGNIYFNSNGTKKELIGADPFQISRFGIGRMFQDNHIFKNMSVLENMLIADSNAFGEIPFQSFIFFKKNRTTEIKRVEKAKQIFIDLFGTDNRFWEMRKQKASTLSYGQQRLLGLARLLMGNYQLLLLDEPTNGVNTRTINDIMRIIKYIVEKKNLTVFLIEHNMNVVKEIADFCSFMSQGRITAFGTPEDVMGDGTVRKTYLGI